MIEKIRNFFKGHERTVKAKKNILASFAVKGLSIMVGFFMIRVAFNYLDQTKYGIWLTLASFLTWFSFFEIGLGRGLQNKLAEALAVKDYKLAKIYVSTTYGILSLIVSFIAIVFVIVNFFIDWTLLLNTEKSLAQELTNLSFIVFGFFFLRFVLNLITIVLTADQKPAVANALNPIGNILSFIIIYILTLTTEGSLLYLGIVLSFIPTLVLIVASLYFYNSEYRYLYPSIKYIRFEYARNLLNLGLKFFVIQISSLVIYQSSNIIIAQAFGPDEVVVYNVAYKLFSVMGMGFTIIVTPFWAAFTEAWAKHEHIWIRNIITNLLKVWLGITLVGVVMLIISNKFYDIWLGEKIQVPFKVSFMFWLYFTFLIFGGVFRTFINGVGYVRLQMYSAVLEMTIFILSSLFFIKKLNMGVESILIAMILSNFYGIFIAPVQYKKIINNTASGLWKA